MLHESEPGNRREEERYKCEGIEVAIIINETRYRTTAKNISMRGMMLQHGIIPSWVEPKHEIIVSFPYYPHSIKGSILELAPTGDRILFIFEEKAAQEWAQFIQATFIGQPKKEDVA